MSLDLVASLDLADIVGLVGSGLMVIAYAYTNLAKQMSFVIFNLLNLIGALLLGWSLTVHFNLASFLLEIVWGLIAAGGLIGALRKRGR